MTDKERIEKEAIAFATEILGEPPFMMDDIGVTGYIAGATSEHERAQQERQAYRDIIKELLPLAENEIKMSTCIGYSYDKWKSTIEKARKLIHKL